MSDECIKRKTKHEILKHYFDFMFKVKDKAKYIRNKATKETFFDGEEETLIIIGPEFRNLQEVYSYNYDFGKDMEDCIEQDD